MLIQTRVSLLTIVIFPSVAPIWVIYKKKNRSTFSDPQHLSETWPWSNAPHLAAPPLWVSSPAWLAWGYQSQGTTDLTVVDRVGLPEPRKDWSSFLSTSSSAVLLLRESWRRSHLITTHKTFDLIFPPDVFIHKFRSFVVRLLYLLPLTLPPHWAEAKIMLFTMFHCRLLPNTDSTAKISKFFWYYCLYYTLSHRRK